MLEVTGSTMSALAILDHVVGLPVDAIRPGPNDRKVFDAEALGALARSIDERGLLQPILVRPCSDGYELVAGERRWRAVGQVLARPTIAAIVRDQDDLAASAAMLVENVDREALNPMEEAAAYQSRMDRFDLTPGQVAEMAGVSVARVITRLPLIRLVPEAADLVVAGSLSINHGRSMSDLDVNRQRIALRALNTGRLSYFEFADLCQRLRDQQAAEEAPNGGAFWSVEEYVEGARNARAARGRSLRTMLAALADALDVVGAAPELVLEARTRLAQ